jgi:hypothetical protein
MAMSLTFRVAAVLAFPGAGLTIPSVAADATVDIAHGGFWITAGPASVEAGQVTFDVRNAGAIIHEFKSERNVCAIGRDLIGQRGDRDGGEGNAGRRQNWTAGAWPKDREGARPLFG